MINRTVLVGRITKDPEIRYSSNGIAVANFTIAVNRTFSKENEADFINCVCFKKTAENLANYQKKGNQIGVDGRIQTRNYENKEGNRVYVTEIVADQIAFLDSKSKDATPVKEDPFKGQAEQIDIDDSSLPF